ALAGELRIGIQATFGDVYAFVFLFFTDAQTHHRLDDAPHDQAGAEYPGEDARHASNCAPKVASALVAGTIRQPQIPTTPCTEMAPTGSSIFRRSRPRMLNTTRTPPTAPISTACSALGVSGSAVMATRPA